jgi:formylglycine-generating enzyme required for sulfatase activity
MARASRRTFGFLLLLTGLLPAAGCRQAGQAEPAVPDSPAAAAPVSAVSPIALEVHDGRVKLPGGTFRMGTADAPELPAVAREHVAAQGETPVHEVTLAPFWIDAREVTVAQFAGFVRATGYRTDAERFGWSGVFNVESGLWTKSDGASWRHPDGPASRAADDEPVTQVSWADATAYAAWRGGRLPTEAEWEYAARGGRDGEPFVWGREARPRGQLLANWWQGRFPDRNSGEDGFTGRAPAGSFAPNGYGLYDVAGNVWEWCADWFDREYYARSPRENPAGPPAGTERVMRGGSWLCADNFCANYRPGARSSATPDTGLNNVGFRTVRDVGDVSVP